MSFLSLPTVLFSIHMSIHMEKCTLSHNSQINRIKQLGLASAIIRANSNAQLMCGETALEEVALKGILRNLRRTVTYPSLSATFIKIIYTGC